MADLTKFLSFSGLQRYDSKIKAFISEKVAGHLLFEIVESLASVTTPKDNVIYLIPNSENPNNVKDEYMWINGAWELIGTTAVDLTPYYKITDADAKFETIVNADLVRGRVSGLETRMTTAEGEIDALQAAVDNVYTKDDIDSKVSTINGAIATESQAREALAGVVANKAAQTDLEAEVQAREALAERVSTAESEIDALQAAVDNVYTKDDVYTKGEVDELIDGVNNSASTLEARVEANEGAIAGLQDTKADKADLEAEVEAREALAERVTTAESEIDALQTSVANVYTKDDIDDKVDTINGEIATKAAQTDLEAEVEAREALAGVVATKANADDVYTKTDVDGKVNTINAAIDTKATKATTLEGYGITDGVTTEQYSILNGIVDTKAAASALEEEVEAREELAGVVATKANAADVYTKSEVYTKAEVEAMFITDAEIDSLFAPASPENA